MSRLHLIATEETTAAAKPLLDAVKSKLGLVPNMTRAMANSPAVLDGYLHLSGALSGEALSPSARAARLGCLARESMRLLPRRSLGDRQDGRAQCRPDSRQSAGDSGRPQDKRADPVRPQGDRVAGAGERPSIAEVREAGFDDGAIAEVVAHVGLNVLTNYFNNVAETDVDFPKADELTTHSL